MSLNLIMGARNGAKTEREKNDYYATHPYAVRDFLTALDRDNVNINICIWECACGEGHMADVFKNNGYNVYATDLIDRGYGIPNVNFLTTEDYPKNCDIFTNPPFKLAQEFAYRGNEVLSEGYKFGLFVKIQFLEGKARKKLFEEYPPKYIYVYSERQQCALNGNFEEYKKGGKTQAYIWVIWEKGFKGEPVVRWI